MKLFLPVPSSLFRVSPMQCSSPVSRSSVFHAHESVLQVVKSVPESSSLLLQSQLPFVLHVSHALMPPKSSFLQQSVQVPSSLFQVSPMLHPSLVSRSSVLQAVKSVLVSFSLLLLSLLPSDEHSLPASRVLMLPSPSFLQQYAPVPSSQPQVSPMQHLSLVTSSSTPHTHESALQAVKSVLVSFSLLLHSQLPFVPYVSHVLMLLNSSSLQQSAPIPSSLSQASPMKRLSPVSRSSVLQVVKSVPESSFLPLLSLFPFVLHVSHVLMPPKSSSLQQPVQVPSSLFQVSLTLHPSLVTSS